MGIDIGRILGDLATGGGTYFKRQKKAKRRDREANEMIAQNTELAQQMFDRDYGTSEWENVQSDPALRAAQDRALAQLSETGGRLDEISREGFTDLDRRALDQAFMQSRREEQSQRAAVMDAAARRGDAGGGNAVLGSLMAQQGGANRSARQGTDVALAGRDRALRALEAYGQNANQQGSMASGMRAQDFSEQGQRAGGLDSFTQWATGQRSADAAALMNARSGQAQNVQQQAAAMRATPALDATVQYGAASLTGGATTALGAVGGGGNSVGVAGAKSMPSMGEPPPTAPPGTPSAGLAQKAMPGVQTGQGAPLDIGRAISDVAGGPASYTAQRRRRVT